MEMADVMPRIHIVAQADDRLLIRVDGSSSGRDSILGRFGEFTVSSEGVGRWESFLYSVERQD